MPRHPRLRLAEVPFHVIQRGNNRGACFSAAEDCQRYLAYLAEQIRRHRVAVHAYVLMTNHVHLLMTPGDGDAVSRVMKFVGQLYAQYVNRKYERTGSLWEGRFRSCLVDSEEYLLHCHRYIEGNPVRAGMTRHPGHYPWSSYRANAEGVASALLSPHPCVTALGRAAPERRAAYRELFRDELPPGVLEEIRTATRGGYVVGRAPFKRRVASALGRPVEPQKRGPKPISNIRGLTPINIRGLTPNSG